MIVDMRRHCLMCNIEMDSEYLTCESCYTKINNKVKDSGKELQHGLVDDLVALIRGTIVL